MILEIIQQVLESETLTDALTEQINQLLWSHNFDSNEMNALQQLLSALDNNQIRFN